MRLNIQIAHVNDSYLTELYTNAKIASLMNTDSGVDLYCPEDVLVKAKETKFINLGIKCSATVYNNGIWQPQAYHLYPRSSLSKTPLRLANSVGVIDSGYRGPIIAAVDNIRDEEYLVKKGTRLFQICAPDLSHIDFNIVTYLDVTARGEGGFGSTGI